MKYYYTIDQTNKYYGAFTDITDITHQNYIHFLGERTSQFIEAVKVVNCLNELVYYEKYFKVRDDF